MPIIVKRQIIEADTLSCMGCDYRAVVRDYCLRNEDASQEDPELGPLYAFTDGSVGRCFHCPLCGEELEAE